MKIKSNPLRFVVFFVVLPLVMFGCATQSHLKHIDRIVVFGDSNVDTGNLAKIFGGTVPQLKMWQGRNSNGPVVTEYLAEMLGAELVTYAVSGALTGDDNVASLLAPELEALNNTGVLKQASNFRKNGGRFTKHDLVIIWAGSNDIFRADRNDRAGLKQRIDSAVNNLGSAIDQFTALGASNLVVGLRTPRPQLNSDDDLNGQDLNRALVEYIQNRQLKGDPNIVVFDAYTNIKDMIRQPDIYGFMNVSGLCVDEKSCSSERYEDGLKVANTYLNWDAAHKTTRVHYIMASQLEQILNR